MVFGKEIYECRSKVDMEKGEGEGREEREGRGRRRRKVQGREEHGGLWWRAC